MSTAKFDTLSNLAGSLSVPVGTVVQGSAKAWVNFNGTGTPAIRAAFNVTSITDNGTGNYTVNLTTAMPDANYAVVASGGKINATNDGNNMVAIGSTTTTISTTAIPIANHTATVGQTDNENLFVAVFR